MSACPGHGGSKNYYHSNPNDCPDVQRLTVREEPSYLAFARQNVAMGLPSSPMMVRELIARIDRQDAELAEYKENVRMHIERAEGR